MSGEQKEMRVTLCLSGGGFRATLFHLGMVKALRAHLIEGEMALQRVANVYAVSGGSILAAHMLKNWERYTSADESEFKQASDEVLIFAKRDVRNRVFRRAGLTFLFKKSSTHWLQDEYASRRFLGTDTLDESYDRNGLPMFHFLATNFNSGELCSFSGKNFELTERIENGTFATHATPAGSIPLSFAVAASSSFPIAFPPLTLTPQMLGRPESKHFKMPIELSDGGVYDNFGVDKYVIERRAGSPSELLIVSNAGGSFQADPEKSYDAVLVRNMRASDVMMRRVGEGTLQAGRQDSGDGFTLVRIGATTTLSQISQTTQQMLRLVRTDLDRFDAPLAGLLVDHGEGVARDAFRAKGWQTNSEFSGHAGIKNEEAAINAVERAARSGIAAFFFDFRDLAWVLAWYTILIGGVYSVYLGWSEYTQYKVKKDTDSLVAAREDAKEETKEKIRVAIEPVLFDVSKALKEGNLQLAQNNLDKALTELGSARKEAIQASLEKPGGPTIKGIERTEYSQRVFIQFAGVLTREQITSLNIGLRNADWDTQGGSGERIAMASGLNEVRYSGLVNREAAQDLADAINKSGLRLAKEVGIQEVSIIGPNDLEVWISR